MPAAGGGWLAYVDPDGRCDCACTGGATGPRSVRMSCACAQPTRVAAYSVQLPSGVLTRKSTEGVDR